MTPDEAGDYLAAIRKSGKTGVTRMEHWLEQTSFRQRPALAFVAGQQGRARRAAQDPTEQAVRTGQPTGHGDLGAVQHVDAPEGRREVGG